MLVYLVRHPTPDIAPGLCYGRFDCPLHPQAQGETAGLIAALADQRDAAIWCSPATRCRQPAALLATALGGSVQIDPRLHELDFGDWEGQRWDDIPRESLDRWAAAPWSFAPPNGESGAALLARVRDVLRDLVAAGQDCVVLSHGGPLRLLAPLLRGQKPDLLAPSPGFAVIDRILVQPAAITLSTAHSTATTPAPSTSPV